MFELYEKRLKIYIFTSLFLVLLFLFSAIYFSFSTILTKDYTQKNLHFSKQTATNIVSIFDQQEEMMEIFINKHNLKEQIKNHNLVLTPSIVKQFSLDMLHVCVFTADGIFYASDPSRTYDLKELFAESHINESAQRPDKLWIISTPTENNPNRPEAFAYIRKMTDDTDTFLGYLMVLISEDPFVKILNAGKDNTFSNFSKALIQFDNQIINLFGQTAPASEELPGIENGNYKIKNGTIVSSNEIKNKNGMLITYKTMKYLSRQIQLLRIALIIIFIIMISITYISLNGLVKRIIKPLNKLNHEIQNYAKYNDL